MALGTWRKTVPHTKETDTWCWYMNAYYGCVRPSTLKFGPLQLINYNLPLQLPAPMQLLGRVEY